MTNGTDLGKFIKKKWYLLLFFVVGCSLIGALKGASIESKRTVGITERDREIRERIDAGEDIDAPIFIGQIPLASEQNEFLCYKTALTGAGIGVVVGLIMLAVYYGISRTSVYQYVKRLIGPRDNESRLFIDL